MSDFISWYIILYPVTTFLLLFHMDNVFYILSPHLCEYKILYGYDHTDLFSIVITYHHHYLHLLLFHLLPSLFLFIIIYFSSWLFFTVKLLTTSYPKTKIYFYTSIFIAFLYTLLHASFLFLHHSYLFTIHYSSSLFYIVSSCCSSSIYSFYSLSFRLSSQQP